MSGEMWMTRSRRSTSPWIFCFALRSSAQVCGRLTDHRLVQDILVGLHQFCGCDFDDVGEIALITDETGAAIVP